MAADDMYVETLVSAKCDFATDAKKAIEKAFENGIKRASGLTTDVPKDKKSARCQLDAKFTGAPDKDGKNFSGKLDASLIVIYPTNSAAKLSTGGKSNIAKVGKLSADDVTAVAQAVAEELIKKAVDTLKKLKP